jgi:hypothetical protein
VIIIIFFSKYSRAPKCLPGGPFNQSPHPLNFLSVPARPLSLPHYLLITRNNIMGILRLGLVGAMLNVILWQSRHVSFPHSDMIGRLTLKFIALLELTSEYPALYPKPTDQEYLLNPVCRSVESLVI